MSAVEQLPEAQSSKYQFLLIPPFRLPGDTQWGYQTLHLDGGLPKLDRLMNADMVLPYLGSTGICIRVPKRPMATGRSRPVKNSLMPPMPA